MTSTANKTPLPMLNLALAMTAAWRAFEAEGWPEGDRYLLIAARALGHNDPSRVTPAQRALAKHSTFSVRFATPLPAPAPGVTSAQAQDMLRQWRSTYPEMAALVPPAAPLSEDERPTLIEDLRPCEAPRCVYNAAVDSRLCARHRPSGGAEIERRVRERRSGDPDGAA